MNILDRIVATKREEVSRLAAGPVTVEMLRQAIEGRGQLGTNLPKGGTPNMMGGVRDFYGALDRARGRGVGLIAEVKKASPSAGIIRPDFDPVRIAREYENAGAHCLSVLTDVQYFQGSLDYLRQIRQAVRLPLLRKDFIIDERQILEAVRAGADAVLLIVAILSDQELAHFHHLATAAGLTALVEVHDEAELDRATAAGARLIGVNNRNLKTFKVDLGTTERLAARLQAGTGSDRLLVAESGIHTRADVQRLARCGAGAILVGESLMREKDFAAKVEELIGWGG